MDSISDVMLPLAKLASNHLKGFDLENLLNTDIEEFERKNYQKYIDMYFKSNKKRMYNSSIYNEPEVLDQHFKDFKVENIQQKNALSKAVKITKRIAKGERVKAVLSGKAGTGKTMLSVCMLNYLNKNTDNTCLFISFAKLMDWERIKAGGTDQERALKIESAIKRADIVVWDDLGSETAMKQGGHISEATEYTQKVLFNLVDSRKSKTDIYTTNNTSAELAEIYNDKLISRMITKRVENTIIFDGMDQRKI